VLKFPNVKELTSVTTQKNTSLKAKVFHTKFLMIFVTASKVFQNHKHQISIEATPS
jgi:hypothetical protein